MIFFTYVNTMKPKNNSTKFLELMSKNFAMYSWKFPKNLLKRHHVIVGLNFMRNQIHGQKKKA